MTPEMMRHYRNSRYAPENSCIVVAGGITPARMKETLEEKFVTNQPLPEKSDISSNPWKDITAAWEGNSELRVEPSNRPLAYICYSWATKCDIIQDIYPARLLERLIDYNSKNSLFYKNIRKTGICATASYDVSIYPPVMEHEVSFSTTRDKVDDVFTAIRDFVFREVMEDSTITTNLLNRLKQEHIGKKTLNLENNLSLTIHLISKYLERGSKQSPDQEFREVNRVTRDALDDMVKRFVESREISLYATGNVDADWKPDLSLLP
jgi:predicted Zn-dependent peptidase